MEAIRVGHAPLPQGKTVQVASEIASPAQTKEWLLNTDADAALFSVYVDSVAGDLDISIYTETEAGKQLLVTTFPTISAPTTELFLKKAAQIISHLRVVATWTGTTTFEMYARGVASNESSVRIIGAVSATATQQDVPTAPTLVIPAALTDRAGLILKNYSTGAEVLYIGFSSAEANTASGYPLVVGESMGIDVSSGVEVWAISSTGTADVRILQAGG